MEMPDHVVETILERIKDVQLTLRDVRSELLTWRQKPIPPAVEFPMDSVEPPTEKQIQYLKGLGVEEVPASKLEARQLLKEIIEKREVGEYSIPPTEKQLRFLKSLKYEGPAPETKEEAWKLIQELRGIE